MGRVEPIAQKKKFFIIIKLSRKKYNYKYVKKKLKDQYQCIAWKVNKNND